MEGGKKKEQITHKKCSEFLLDIVLLVVVAMRLMTYLDRTCFLRYLLWRNMCQDPENLVVNAETPEHLSEIPSDHAGLHVEC